jgi:hypothetical protein
VRTTDNPKKRAASADVHGPSQILQSAQAWDFLLGTGGKVAPALAEALGSPSRRQEDGAVLIDVPEESR